MAAVPNRAAAATAAAWTSSLIPSIRASICPQCRRTFSTRPALLAGHNKWSKIRHGKGVADAKKRSVNQDFAKSLTLYSRLYGPSPDGNPQLATVLTQAKKAGVPKATIEAAIARGQGRSGSGATLESISLEVLMPPSVALILEVEADNRMRALQELSLLVKKHGGSVTPTRFLFTRRGRVVFARRDSDGGSSGSPITADDVLDAAIEAGAEDIEDGGGGSGDIVLWTPPNRTAHVAREVGRATSGLTVAAMDIIWSPNDDTRAPVGGDDELRLLADLVAAFRENPDVQAVYSNAVRRDDDTREDWDRLEELISV